MKKFLIPFLLITVLLVSGCSCSNKTRITIDGDVSKTVSHLEYDVYLADYSDGTNHYTYDSKNTYGELTMKGTYVVDLVKGVNLDSLPAEVSQEMREGLAGETIYKQTTKLLLDVTSEKANVTNTDTIETISYFYSNNLTPLYSKTISDTTYISLVDETPKFSKIKSSNTTIYDSSTYKIESTIDEETETEEYEYEKFTVLDNTSLLLAIQNIALEKEKDSKSVSVISGNYGNEQGVAITYQETIESKTISGTDYSNIKLARFSIVGESAGCLGSNTGKSQIVYLSNNTMIKYVSPLCSSDISYTSIGALQFDLKQ